MLEVGAGELNILDHVAKHFGDQKQYLGIELSLNRLCHGVDFFCRKQGLKAELAKADACFLPLPDKSVDVGLHRSLPGAGALRTTSTKLYRRCAAWPAKGFI